MLTCVIRDATLADVPALNTLVNSAYRGDSSRVGWTTEADLLGGIRTDESQLTVLMEQPGSRILLCERHGNDSSKLVGCVNIRVNKDNGLRKLYLGMLTVAPPLQNQGLGKMLLNAAESEARNEGCSSVYMTVITLRTELIDWYKRHGYSDTQRREPFPMNDPKFGEPTRALEFLVLEKRLGEP